MTTQWVIFWWCLCHKLTFMCCNMNYWCMKHSPPTEPLLLFIAVEQYSHLSSTLTLYLVQECHLKQPTSGMIERKNKFHKFVKANILYLSNILAAWFNCKMHFVWVSGSEAKSVLRERGSLSSWLPGLDDLRQTEESSLGEVSFSYARFTFQVTW